MKSSEKTCKNTYKEAVETHGEGKAWNLETAHLSSLPVQIE